jgi:hypothetical protein
MCVRTVKVGSLVQYGYATKVCEQQQKRFQFTLCIGIHTEASARCDGLQCLEHGRSIECAEAISFMTFWDDDRTILMTLR